MGDTSKITRVDTRLSLPKIYDIFERITENVV